MAKVYPAGVVTAYGAAKKGGYQGTYQDFCNQQANYASSAASVAQAKTDTLAAQEAAEAAAIAADMHQAEADARAKNSGTYTDANGQTITITIGKEAWTNANGQSSQIYKSAKGYAAQSKAEATISKTAAAAAAASESNAADSAEAAAGSASDAADALSDIQDIADSIPAGYDEMIVISDEEPESEHNKLWLKATPEEEYLVPSYDEFQAASVNKSIDTPAPVQIIQDGADGLLLGDLKVAIEPVQSGSGNPSSSNIRAITGWTGMTVKRTGRNICPLKITDFTFTATGGATFSLDQTNGVLTVNYQSKDDGVYALSNSDFADLFDFIEENGLYAKISFKLCASYGSIKYCIGGGESTTVLSSVSAGEFVQISNDLDTQTIAIYSDSDSNRTETFQIKDLQIEVGSDYSFLATDYEPYTLSTYNISFPSAAGTVYGGELDLITGVLTVDRANIASYSGQTLPGEWISDRDVYSAGGTPSTGAQVVYKLAEPVTYQLTPVEIRTLLGKNYLWADTGDITHIEYLADSVQYGKNEYAEKRDTVLETSLSRGRKELTDVGTGSLAFGNDVEASGSCSKATGFNTAATSHGATAEGKDTKARGRYSKAEGQGTNAFNRSQHVQGEYNVFPEIALPNARGTYAEIVGNGTADDARSNARALEWSGDERLAGDLFLNCNPDSTGGVSVMETFNALPTEATGQDLIAKEEARTGLMQAALDVIEAQISARPDTNTVDAALALKADTEDVVLKEDEMTQHDVAVMMNEYFGSPCIKAYSPGKDESASTISFTIDGLTIGKTYKYSFGYNAPTYRVEYISGFVARVTTFTETFDPQYPETYLVEITISEKNDDDTYTVIDEVSVNNGVFS